MKLLLVGCGHLGRSLLKAWDFHSMFYQTIVVQPSLSAESLFNSSESISFVKSLDELLNPDSPFFEYKPDTIVFSVKPDQAAEVLPPYGRYQGSAVFISVMSGVSIDKLQSYLGVSETSATIIRAMPNVAAAAQESMTLLFSRQVYSVNKILYRRDDLSLFGRRARSIISRSPLQKRLEKIFNCCGKWLWIGKEELLEKLIPITGSGPAFFFALAEELAKAAHNLGMEKELAQSVACQVLFGSAKLVDNHEDLADLKSQVTVKKGLTAAALEVIDQQLPSLMRAALEAAWNRLETWQK